MMRITARLIGSVEIRDADGSELDTLPSQPKRFGLLCYLLTAQPRGFHRRDKLVGLFWPEASQDQARHSLSQALHVLRGELGEGTIRSRGDGDVAIDEATISCDAVEFELAVDAGEYEKALELYRGDFLEGWFIREAPEFERWLEDERTRLREKAAGAAWCLAHEHLTEDRLVDAERIAQRALLLVATDESEVRRFIQALADAGDRAAAVRFYEKFTQRLQAEYEIEPDPVTVECAQRIRNKKSSADRGSAAEGSPEAGHTAQVRPSTVRPVVAGRPRRRRAWVWGAGITVLAALGTAIGMLATRNRGPQVALPQPVYRQLTYDGNVRMAALSPNGQYLAYMAWGSPTRIMVQDLAGGTALVVADSIGDPVYLRWSPDGTRLGFSGEYRGRFGLHVVPRLGGAHRFFQRFLHFAWSPDGTRIARWSTLREWGIKVQDLTSGETDSVVVPGTDEFSTDGDWSPHGELLALRTSSSDGPSNLWVLDLAKGTHVLTLADSVEMLTPRWAPDGNAVYYLRDDDLHRIPVDPRSGRALGAAQRVLTLEGVRVSGFGMNTYVFSGDGSKLAYTRVSGYTNFSIARVATGGDVQQVTLTTGTAEKSCPSLSPDGSSLAFVQKVGDGRDLYRVSTSGGTPERLTFGGSVAPVCPAWGPSGQRLAFVTEVGGTRKLAVLAASGGTAHIFENTQVSHAIAWGAGTRIAYQVPGNRNFRLLDPETEEDQLLVRNDSVGWSFNPQLSPEGTEVAVRWNRGAVSPGANYSDFGLWVISLSDSSQVQLVEGNWRPIGWSKDGQIVYAVDDQGVFRRFPLAGGEGVAVPQPGLARGYCTPHERPEVVVWVCSVGQFFSDVWMIENFDPEYAGRLR
jgi:Tol biopolymer transport system component/DNA-binding SARP family transcriptional activator